MAKSETAQIAQLDERIKSLDANIKHLITDVDAFKDRLSKTDSSGVEQMKKDYQSLQKRIEDLGKSQERTAKSVDEQIQKVSRSRRVDNKILERQNQLLAAQKRLASTGDLGQRFSSLKNSLGSIDFNSILATANAKTGGQKILQESTSGLKKAQQDYKNALDKTTNSIKQQKSTLESMLPTLRRLAGAFGVAFSVQGLVQFGKKLIETRGQFEMQFVAMKQIIGDVDEATKIWNQTMQQALQSPFRAMQLVDYTKKLAAYRIETDKLFDTTKRLADVSAGLGVDMGRLILAYGQVKTANYLRASEVRQFTEAGVNIYGELAKYFTEIEGRAVGTAEVVERVSKRMVLFSDVEKIFQRMTDEGGTFFNMQEVQAETVRGQIMKLRDAYDQMLNTIGQSNEGIIRNFVDALNDLVRNWQNVKYILDWNINWFTAIGAALLLLSRSYLKNATTQTLWFAKSLGLSSKMLLKNTADVKIFSKAIGDYTLKQRLAIVGIRTMQGALSKLGAIMKVAAPFILIEGIIMLIENLTRASRELNRFREELQSVASENVNKMNDEIRGYDALIKKLKQTNEGTTERKEILDEISNKYGKYLDFIITEKTTVEELAGAYDKVVSSIRNYTAEKIREEQQQKLEKGMYGKFQDFIGGLTGRKIADAEGKQFEITKEQAKNIAKLIQQSLDKYGVADIQSILETYFGMALGRASAGGENAGIGNTIRSYINEWGALNQELQNVRNDIEGQTPVFSSDAEYKAYKKRVEDSKVALAEQAKKNEEIIKGIKEKTREEAESWKIEDEIHAQEMKNAEEELRIRKQYELITEQQYKDSLARLHGQLDSYETDYNVRITKSLSDKYGENWKTASKDARDMYNYIVSTEDRLQQGTSQRNKQLIESYKELKESLKEYNAQMKAAKNNSAGEEAIKKIQGDIDWATLMMKAIELAAEHRGLDLSEKKKTPRTAKNYDSISTLISLLKEMNSEYDKLSKSAYGFAKSNEKVVESFTPAFKEIFGFAGIDISQVDTTSKRSTADAMKLVIDTLDEKDLWGKFGRDGGKKARKEFVKAWSQEDVEADMEIQVRIREDFGRQMEEAFGNYELTLELQKLNLSSDVLSDLFNLEAVGLSDLRRKVVEFYNERVAAGADPTELVKQVEGYYKKIDEMERKQQRERIKEYAKYLEYELSERAKIEMEYTRKSADVAANPAFTQAQKKQIQKRLEEERDKAVAKQEWEDFKSSETYIQMMEDLEHQGTNALMAMRVELERMRENAENLSPRALKEVVNALEKIDEIAMKRGLPISNIINSAYAVRGARVGALESGLLFDQVSSRKAAKQTQADIKAQLLPMEQQYNILQSQLGAEKEIARLEQERYENGRKLEEIFGEAFLTGDNEYLQELISSRLADMESSQNKIAELTEQRKSANEGDLKVIDKQLAEEQSNIESLMAENELLQKQLKYNLAIAKAALNRAATPEERASLQARIDAMEEELEKLRGQDAAVGELTKKYGILDESIVKAIENFKNMLSTFDSFKTMMDSFGVDTSTGGWAMLDAAKQTVGAMADVAGKIASGDYIGAAIAAVTGIFESIAAWNKASDQYLQDTIEEEQRRIEALRDAYARLERQIEKTWSTIDYMNTYEQQVENIRAQIRSMEAQLAAERDKKNTDDNAVRQYQRDIQDAYDQLEELEQKSIEVFGGIGEEGYRSAAQGFVEAWKSAFLETGDGLQGLQDHFDEFLQNWFVNQATMRIAGGMLEPVFRQIDSAVDAYGEGGTSAMLSEIERVRDMAAAIFPDLSLALEDLAGMFGVGGEGSLSGLAAGIQGMTEEQANILEAYWNSVRMYTASIDMNVARIAEMLGVGGANTNPMLKQMQTIANNTAYIKQIYDLLAPTAVNLGQGKGFRNYSV